MNDVELTSFVGRRDDLAEGRRLLGNARLVTLVGPGGVGKTRLARRLAEEVSRSFPDGVYVVQLASLADAGSLVAELARTLPIKDSSPSDADGVAGFVRDRRLLLLFDNCEHLVEAAARLAHTLLQQSPGLRVVATSRQPLGVAGEQLMTVAPLALPPMESPLGGPMTNPGEVESEAVQLFVGRARLVVPGFTLDEANAHLVVQLCRRLDGIPLAIELAAARLRVLSLRQLAQRLRDRFEVLAVGASAALPHHQTLRASVDWSFELCSADEQALWAQMSVFEGGADLDDVEAVCGSPGVSLFDTVAALVDKSVLTPEEVAGRVRYRMLETIRAYGHEHLDASGDAAHLRERHRSYFVELATAAGQSWFGPSQRDQMAWAVAAQPNLRLAFDTCLTDPAHHRDALRLVSAIWWFWIGHGGIDEGLRWFDLALGVAQPSTALNLESLTKAALLAGSRGDVDAYLAYSQRATELDVEAGGSDADYYYAWASSNVSACRGDSRSAMEILLQLLGDAVDTDRLTAEQVVITTIGLSLRVRAPVTTSHALELVDDAIDICGQHGEEWQQSFLLAVKGARLADLGHHDEALAAEREALRLGRGGFHGVAVVGALEQSARIFALLDRADDAAVLLGALSSLRPGIGAGTIEEVSAELAHQAKAARGLIGDEAYEEAYERGRRMTVDEIVTFALEEQRTATPAPAVRGPLPVTDLTTREHQVAALVARGLSNKEIAEALVISPRTAEGHVTRLLDKLGVASRASVAAWVAERRAGSS